MGCWTKAMLVAPDELVGGDTLDRHRFTSAGKHKQYATTAS